MTDLVLYEQPIDELVRVCLRLELLFKQLDYTLTDASVWGSRFAIDTLLEIINAVDRPDIKNRFTQTLTNYAISFSALTSNPHVDEASLQSLLLEIDQLIDGLHADHQKIGKSLRDRPFINQIKQHANSPGGLNQFNTPAYHLWLEQAFDRRIADLKSWRSELKLLELATQTILRITRSSKKQTQETADNGYFQASFEPGPALYLIQVGIPNNSSFYPRISVSKHYISIYFYTLGDLESRHEIHADTSEIPFELSCCLQQVNG